VRYLLSLALVLLVACIEPTPPTNTPTDVTGMEPVTAGTLPKLVSCDQIGGAGNIVQVNSTPAHKYWPASGNPFNVFGQIIRDNVSIPGVQYHCEDLGMKVEWQVYFGSPACLVEPWNNQANYSSVLQLTCGATGSVWKAIAIPMTLGGTIASSLRDTSYIHH
jgi:hypothetical protein